MVSKMHEVRLASLERIQIKPLIARGIGVSPVFRLKTQVFNLTGGGAAKPPFHTGKPMVCMHLVYFSKTKSIF